MNSEEKWMKRVTKRLISIILVIVMCMQVLPMTAFAALIDNDPAYNEEILDALTDLVGSEDEAERYYALLDRYGLLDEDGNMSESWEIWMDGRQVTLDEITALLENGDYDPDKYVLVDGTAVTLGNIKTILEIEEYIAYLQEKYYDGYQWTEEQQASLMSLMKQIENEGILFASDSPAEPVIGASGVSHSARVTVTAGETVITSENSLATNTAQMPDKIFDGDRTTKWYSTAGVANTTEQTFPLWAQVALDEAVTVKSYGIVTGDDKPERDPSDWILYGSNDGEFWTILDKQDNNPLPEDRNTEMRFDLAESHTFRYFRFEVKARRGSDNPSGYGVQLSELVFYDENGYPVHLNNRFTARLTDAAAGQQVSFAWEALSGSQPVSGNGTVAMTADESGSASASFSVTLGSVEAVASAAPVYYVKLDGLTNALFTNERPSTVVSGYGTASVTKAKMDEVVNVTQNATHTFTAASSDAGSMQHTFSLSDAEQKAVQWGVLDRVELTNYATNTVPSTGRLTAKSTAILDSVCYTLSNGNTAILAFEKTYERNTITTSYIPHSVSLDPTVQELQITEKKLQNKLYNTDNLASLLTGNSLVVNGTASYITYGTDYYIKKSSAFPETGVNVYYWVPTEIGSGSGLGSGNPLSCTITFMDTIAPSVQSFYAPAETYYPGQVVPVTVTFSEPVNAASAKVKFNGESAEISAAEASGYSNVLTFPYTVKDVDNASLSISSVTAADLGGKTLSGYNPGGNAAAGLQIIGVTLSTPMKEDAITNVTADVTSGDTEAVLNVTVDISSNEKITAWMQSAQDATGKLYAEGLTVSLDGGETMYNLYFIGDSFQDGLTASIPLEMLTENAVTHVAELYLGGKLLIGKYAAATQTPVVFITEDSLTTGFQITNPDGSDYTSEDGLIYLQDNPSIYASYTLDREDYTFSDSSQFIWTSNNTAVANIDNTGKITPTGTPGTVNFTLTALNGGVEGKECSVTTEELTIGVGLTPFLSIPEDELHAAAGKPLSVFWTSNIIDKNGLGIDTVFTATLGERTETVVNTAGFTIPADWLQYDYSGGSNTYTFTVSTVYNGEEYTDSVIIHLTSSPAVITLEKLESYYVTDEDGAVSVGWNIRNFDQYSAAQAADLFRFEITRNGEPVQHSNVPGTGFAGEYSGFYSLTPADVRANSSDPTSYRDVYTVTIQAKNGSDSTWSYDSFLLYVYDADALKIWVDGAEDADGRITMSNVAKIRDMDQEEILALKRDIYLKNIISANYGEYAWTEVADQIAWKSSDSSTASINYQQGTLYENIESFDYVSYRPTTEFGLSGLQDGKAVISAEHKLAGMTAEVDVTVETLEDKLYLFQCYPQAKTTLLYQDSDGEWQEVQSDENGAAAIYEGNGIHSDVYCSSVVDGVTYLGTFYLSGLETGEGDWTRLERYPCNNLTMRRAAYAYLYIKKTNGTPYTGSINFRGGVYVNGEYKENALFGLNTDDVNAYGNADNTVSLAGTNGKLTIYMDQTQWDLPGNIITALDDVSYVFEISQANDTAYYPLLLTVDANVNMDTFVGDGSAVVTFRENPEQGEHPFIAAQTTASTRTVGNDSSVYTSKADVMTSTGYVGPSDTYQESVLTTSVMWWGETIDENNLPKLQLTNEKNAAIAAADEYHTIHHTLYPFASMAITEYSVKLNATTMYNIPLDKGAATGLNMEYYKDGRTLSRREALPFRLINLRDIGEVENAESITDMLKTMGQATDTNDKKAMGFGDKFVNIALNIVSSEKYSTGDDKLLSIQLAPTNDPTKFLGFIEVNVGNIRDKNQVTGIYAPSSESGEQDIDYAPGLNEAMLIFGKRSIYSYLGDDFNRVLKREGVRNLKAQIGGYAESLIYYSEITGKWEIQVLNGGFNLGAGATYTWNWNTMVGPVPFTASLAIGGTVEVMLDILSVSYYNAAADKQSTFIGNDFLTELRVYLYLHFFAGVGIDYAVIAFKLGIFGQISLDMQFRWLNRPYMDTADPIWNIADGTYNDPVQKFDWIPVPDEDGKLQFDEFDNLVTEPVPYWEGRNSKLNGQHFKIDGQIGLEFVVRFLFLNFEKVLLSHSFNLLDEPVNDWELIQKNWDLNKAAQMSAISSLLGKNALSVSNVGGQQMLSLNLAPTLESRDYLADGSFWNDGSFGTFALDPTSALENLQYNSYPYANPVVTDDGAVVAYLSDMNSTSVEDTRASFALRNAFGMYNEGNPIDSSEGYGDSQIAIAGTENFAAAAWTRQMGTIAKDAGAELTAEDQMIMMNSSEIYAAVYNGSNWITTRLTDNGSADLAPVVAANGNRAIVAWRAVASSGEKTEDGLSAVTTFDEKDTIQYRIYTGTEWSEPYTLYNGTSGSVKGITAAMLNDGTAAVAYTLDHDDDAGTLTDREIYYAVIGMNHEVIRNVRATNDNYLDENPQLAAVTFPGAGNAERFVLGWYTEQNVASDAADTLNGSGIAAENVTTAADTTIADIRLMDFNENGIYTQLLPDSISQAASAYDVSITPSFRFTKNADSITDLSILWVERSGSSAAEAPADMPEDTYSETGIQSLSAEKDVLKGVKFYTYGQNHELISFTGAIDVAEMGDGTLIDHFDAYVSNAANNEIKAVILGSTYGENGVVTRIGTTVSGDTVQYAVPSRTTSMYTATEVYEDKIEVPAVLAEYETIRKGAKTEILFTVKNNGIHAINAVEIELAGGHKTTHDNLNLLPGSSIQLYADYVVPVERINDIVYTVKATFDGTVGASGDAETVVLKTEGRRTYAQELTQCSGTVYLDLPDIEITDASIIREEDGERTILIKLNNDSDSDLAGSERFVRISFYSDATCETPITSLAPIDITAAADLAMIDEGGYSTSVVFDIKDHLESMEDSELTEIPESGIRVFIRTDVIEKDTDGKEEILPEYYLSNNIGSVVCENLKTRTGTDVILTSTLSNDGTEVTVNASVQNTSLTGTTTGNLIVTLLDQNGNILAQQQSYDPGSANNGMVTLAGEEKISVVFTFDSEAAQNVASAAVSYSDLTLTKAEVFASDFTCLLPEAPVYDGQAKTAAITGKDGFGAISIGYYSDRALTNPLEPIHAGTYYVGITMAESEQYQGISEPLYMGSFTIRTSDQADFSISGATTVKYGDVPITLNAAGGSGNGAITWEITSGSEFAEIDGNGTAATLTIKGAGTVTVKATKAADGNYTKKIAVHSIVIGKAAVSASNFTYSAPADLVYSKTAKEAAVTGNEEYGAITIYYYSNSEMTNTVTDPINVGTYYVGITTAGGDNYEPLAKTLVGSFSIAAKTINVAAKDQTRQYNEDNPILTYAADDLYDGDSFTGALATEATKDSNVDSYDITQGTLSAGDNYTISFTGAKLTITKANGPEAPTVTGTSTNNGMIYIYTVNAINGAEYSKDGTKWQDSNVFTGLSAGQTYTFYARIKETDNVLAGKVGKIENVDFSKLDGRGTVTITGWTYGEGANDPEVESTTGNPEDVAKRLYESTDGKGYSSANAPTNAGEYKLTVTFAATDTHNGTTASDTFTIAKATPAADAPTGLTAAYGDTLADVQLPAGWTWKDAATTEVGTVDGTNEFTVIYTKDDSGNYNTVEKTVTITVAPKVVTAAVTVAGENFIFNGSEQKPGVTVKDGENTIPESEYTVTYANNTNAGTATVTITDKEGGNYTVFGETAFAIAKKASSALSGVEREFMRTIATTGNKIDVEAMLPDDHGAVTYTITSNGYTVLENVAVDANGKLVFDTKTSAAAASDTITVEVVMQNYTDVTLTVSVILNDKAPQEISGVTAKTGLIYNGEAQKGYTGTPASEKYTGAYEITYTGRDNTYNSSAAPVGAGDYTVTFKIPDSDLYYSGSVSVNFTIGKAQATVTADDKEAYVGSRMPELTYKVSGLIGDDTISVELSCDANMYRAGDTPIVVTATDPNGNYEITTVNGTLTVEYFPYIPIITPTYPPVVNSGDNGNVVVSPMKPEKGDTVTIIPNPDRGYEVDEIIVTDKNGNPVTVTRNGDGTYSFKQPSGKVNIEVTFKEIVKACPGDKTCPMHGYTDLDMTAWYHDGIHFCIENDLMNGIGDNQFNPGGTTTRAMIVTILWRLEGGPDMRDAQWFEDVPVGQWYSDAIVWAAFNGIVDGYGNGYFGTNDAITREQFVTIMFRYAKYKGYDVSVGENTNILSYDDAFDVADWAIPAMQWACGSGLIQGIANDSTLNLEPQGNATRAQAATILHRFCEAISKEEQ